MTQGRTTAAGSVDATRAQDLVAWFERNARDLPWRTQRTGYTALVAESMLQQTQVARVAERFGAFLERFPDVRTLAGADLEDVLGLWQGLGYYRRARHLHAAARMVVHEMDGCLPDEADDLRRLPGVGRYTAGAIASIVHGKPVPIVDGNVHRVLSRWDGRSGPASDTRAMARTWERAEEVVAHTADPSALNEALMELGATVCTPKKPACPSCPVRTSCAAFTTGDAESLPGPSTPARRLEVHHHVVLIRRGSRLLVERRPEKGLWSGLWQPPALESAKKLPGKALPRAFADRGLPLVRIETGGPTRFVHETTHRRVAFHVYRATTRVRRGEWVDQDRLETLPMSSAHRKVLRVG